MKREHEPDCTCPRCWLFANDPRYQRLADSGRPEFDDEFQSATRCLHRGERLRRLDVPTCKTPPSVFACRLHGECCTIRDSGKRGEAIDASGLPICRECAGDPPTVRNLIYHVFPAAANDAWRSNLRQLARRWRLFNGRKIVAIAVGDGALDRDEVSRTLDELGCEGRDEIVFPNDPQLREAATFLPLLIEVSRESGSTFYAHTKGNSTRGNRVGATRWRNAMYHHLLDRADECMQKLGRFAAVGAQKMVWRDPNRSPYPSKLRHGGWMFAGTFFWFRNDSVFNHPKWRQVPVDRYGAEAWLAGMFDADQVLSMWNTWPERKYPPGSPYRPDQYPEEFDDR